MECLEARPAVIGSTAEYQNHDVGAVLGMAICKQERKHCSAGDVVLFCLFTKLLLPLFGENFVPIRSIKGRSSGVRDSRRGQGIGYHQSTTQSQLTYPTSLSVSPLVYHRPVRSRCRGIPLCTYECPFGPGGSCGIELSSASSPFIYHDHVEQTLSPTYSIWHPHTTLPSLSLDKTNRIATCLCSRRELKPLHCHRKCHTRQTLLKRLTAASVRGQKLKREKRKLACTYTRTVKVTLTRHDGTAHQR